MLRFILAAALAVACALPAKAEAPKIDYSMIDAPTIRTPDDNVWLVKGLALVSAKKTKWYRRAKKTFYYHLVSKTDSEREIIKPFSFKIKGAHDLRPYNIVHPKKDAFIQFCGRWNPVADFASKLATPSVLGAKRFN